MAIGSRSPPWMKPTFDRQCSFTDARSLMYGVEDVEVVPSSTAPLILDRSPS